MEYKLILDSEKCIACGICASVMPELFEEDLEGYAYIKNNYVQLNIVEEQLVKIIRDCPVHAIKKSKL